ncbi:hypothetical protein ASE93_23395 [Serratia sp. Leaf50]|nr:hypothetical protein ASE93_23395 [Serratia sp. Leaf50]
MKKVSVILSAALMLSGCAGLPGQGGDYGKFCDVSGQAQRGDIYHVTGVRDFWLTPAGNYLSDREYGQAGTRALDEVTGLVTRSADKSDNAVRVRVFLVRSESAQSGACLPVTVTDPQYRSMSAKLVIGRRLQVAGDTTGVTGNQVYHHAGSQNFRYRVL